MSWLPNDRHLLRMVDGVGMLQHTICGVPDRKHGYTTDDNARALMVAVLLYERTGEARHLDLAIRTLSFVAHAELDGWFRNFMGYDRNFLEWEGSQDCFGRCIWALSVTATRSCLPHALRQAAIALLERTLPSCGRLEYPRSKAYTLLGLTLLGQPCAPQAAALAQQLADLYEQSAEGAWRWFEPAMTYCNAILPWSLLEQAHATGDQRCRLAGLNSLDFLIETTFRNGIFWPVGCSGWYERGGKPAGHDQQPVEACETLLACLCALDLTREERYRVLAHRCLDWYTGSNSLGESLIDAESGACLDGITPQGLNLNRGAESQVSWWMAWLALRHAEDSGPIRRVL